MAEPTLTVIGVYKPHITEETWQEQFNVTGDDDATREHFDRLVLIEAVVGGLHEPFDMGQFGQMAAGHANDPKWMQVGYDEGLLSEDGEFLIERIINCVRGAGSLRFAVYLHMYDPQRPLRWQFGSVNCLPISEVPVRLMMLMPYCACS
jgi:hypothetical protein